MMTENSGTSNGGGSSSTPGSSEGGQQPQDLGKSSAADLGQNPSEQPAAKSLRSSLGELLGESERTSFDKWASGYTTDKDFAVAAMNMRQTYDARVPVPGKDATPEDMGKYFSRVGKPKSAEDYKFDFGKVELSEDDKALYADFQKNAFDKHFTQQQFEWAVGHYFDVNAKQADVRLGMAEQHQKATVDAMKNEWGVDYDANLLFARQAGSHFAGDEDWKAFADMRLENGMFAGDHPTIMRMMAKIGRGISEDSRARMVMTENEVSGIKERITQLEQEAFSKGSSSYDEPYASQLDSLYKKLYPGKRRV